MKRCRFLLSVITFAALLGATYYFCVSTFQNTFSGTLVVAVGRQERVAAASQAYVAAKAPGLSRAPTSAIPFEDPESGRKYFAQQEWLEFVQLPFAVRADKIYIPPVLSRLTVSEGQDEKSIEIKTGDTVTIGATQYKTASIGKWSGLMRDPQGAPMAAVTLTGDADNAAAMTMLLSSDIWQMTPGGSAFCFRWHAADEQAAQAAAGPAPGIESARWGVVDGGAVNWFQSFTPGTGAFLKNGDEVTLVAFDEEKPAVAVEIKTGDEKRVTWVAANGAVEGVPIKFEYPAAAAHVFVIDAWEDGKAVVTEYQKSRQVAQKPLSQRQWFYPASAGFNVRLDDVLSTAVAVTESKSTLWCAVLRDEAGEEIVLREGEARPMGDSRVQYVRSMEYAAVAYTFTIDGKRQVTLKRGQSMRVGDWRLRPWYYEDMPPLLNVDYMPGRKQASILGLIGLTAVLLRIATGRLSKARPHVAGI